MAAPGRSSRCRASQKLPAAAGIKDAVSETPQLLKKTPRAAPAEIKAERQPNLTSRSVAANKMAAAPPLARLNRPRGMLGARAKRTSLRTEGPRLQEKGGKWDSACVQC